MTDKIHSAKSPDGRSFTIKNGKVSLSESSSPSIEVVDQSLPLAFDEGDASANAFDFSANAFDFSANAFDFAPAQSA